MQKLKLNNDNLGQQRLETKNIKGFKLKNKLENERSIEW